MLQFFFCCNRGGGAVLTAGSACSAQLYLAISSRRKLTAALCAGDNTAPVQLWNKLVAVLRDSMNVTFRARDQAAGLAMMKRLHKVLYEMDKSDAVRKMRAPSQALALPYVPVHLPFAASVCHILLPHPFAASTCDKLGTSRVVDW